MKDTGGDMNDLSALRTDNAGAMNARPEVKNIVGIRFGFRGFRRVGKEMQRLVNAVDFNRVLAGLSNGKANRIAVDIGSYAARLRPYDCCAYRFVTLNYDIHRCGYCSLPVPRTFTDMPTRFIASTASNTKCTMSSPGTQSRMSGGSSSGVRLSTFTYLVLMRPSIDHMSRFVKQIGRSLETITSARVAALR